MILFSNMKEIFGINKESDLKLFSDIELSQNSEMKFGIRNNKTCIQQTSSMSDLGYQKCNLYATKLQLF